MQRFLITFWTILSLSGAFRVYSAVIEPLTTLRNPPPSQVPEEATLPLSGNMVIQAERDFPDLAWAKDATQEYHLSEFACVYTQKLTSNPGSGRTVHVAPVAIIWHNPKRPGEAPLRITADSGELEFENRFYDQAIALSDAKPGRIVAAQLNGVVHIDGPHGLSIDGRQFTFSEQSGQLYSDSPVRFTYGPSPENQARIQGQGEKLVVAFQPAEESILGKDMPRIGKPEKLMLRQNVEIQASFAQGKDPVQAVVTSQGPFEFHFVNHTATFDTQVVVQRWKITDAAPLRDTLRCDWLAVQLEEQAPTIARVRTEPEAEFAGALDNLVFRRLRALGTRGPLGGVGQRLTITSEERQVAAQMEKLTYDALERRIVMEAEDRVVVARETANLESPRVDLILDEHEASQPDRMWLAGPGKLRLINASLGAEPVTADWQEGAFLTPQPDGGLHILQLDRDAQLVVPGKFGVSASRIQVWLDLRQAMADAKEDSSSGTMLSRPLAIKKAAATGDAVFASERLVVKRSDDIQLTINPGKLPPQVREEKNRNGRDGARGEQRPDEAPIFVEADQLLLQVTHDPAGKGRLDVRRAEGIGRVLVRQERPPRKGAPASGALEMSGVRFMADNEGESRQIVSIFGETDQFGKTRTPGRVSLGPARLEGLQITLTREDNTLKVHGPGGMRLPVSKTLGDKKLEQPRMMDVVWSERMAFDGLTARFWGQVTASVPEDAVNISRLTCEELSARLDQRISFADPPSGDADIKLELVEGKHKVEMQAYELDEENGTRFSALRRGRFHAFEFSQVSSDFTLYGPGELQNWTFGDDVRFAPSDAAQANQPARTGDQKWRYSKLSFEGNVVGNMQRRDAVVKHRVEFLSAPVSTPADVFHRDGLSEDTPQSSNAVWLGCEELRLHLEEVPGQQRNYISLLAMGDSAVPNESRTGAELEGHLFRATSDKLEYYQRQEKFVLSGQGTKDAVLHYRIRPKEPAQPSANRRIEFSPSRREVQAFGSAGVSGGSF